MRIDRDLIEIKILQSVRTNHKSSEHTDEDPFHISAQAY